MTHAITHINGHTVTVTGPDAEQLAQALGELKSLTESLHNTLVFHPQDASLYRRDAWLYGVCVGWGHSLSEVATRHGWGPGTQRRLSRLHEVFKTFTSTD